MMTSWVMGPEAWVWMGAWALIMALVVWLLVREPRPSHPEDPDAILRARFARGEITEDEYRRATAALEGDPPATSPIAGRVPRRQETRHD
jgi:uncharacterized membrane protein